MSENYDGNHIKAIFQRVWCLVNGINTLKHTFTKNECDKIAIEVGKLTGYIYSDRTYFDLYPHANSQKKREKSASLDALCAFIMIHDGKLRLEHLKYKTLILKNGEQTNNKPVLDMYAIMYYREYLEADQQKTHNADPSSNNENETDKNINIAQNQVSVTFPNNKLVFIFIAIPVCIMIAHLFFAKVHLPNIIDLYAVILLVIWFYRMIDVRMGFSQPVIGTTFFLVVNTFGYYYSYHIMPNYQISIKPEYEAMYYWGLTTTNVLLDIMAILNFAGYAKLWREING
jgi:hypothetical protein